MSKGSSARAIIVGRMGADIEVKKLSGDNMVGNMRVATTSGYGDKATTSWHNVVVYNKKTIEVLDDYTEKGSRIFVDGELRVREYEKDGSKRYVTEIVVAYDGVVEIIDGRKESTPGTQTKTRGQPQNFNNDYDVDDDIPF